MTDMTALITGASRGIGRAIALELAGPGMLTVALDAALKSQGEPEVSAPEGATLGLVPAAILAALLRGIAPEQLPAVAE